MKKLQVDKGSWRSVVMLRPMWTSAAIVCGLTFTLAALSWAGRDSRSAATVSAQPPVPTPITSPSPTVSGSLPDVSGVWSITRSWYRRCPACGGPTVRTTTWTIRMDAGGGVRVNRGPAGGMIGDGAGGGWLTLEGLESEADSVYRFLYASLWVPPSGDRFEGGFGGSERAQNPCGSSPPIVTCFASAGYLTALKIATFTPSPGSISTPVPTAIGGGGSTTPGPSATSGTPVLPPPPGSTPTAVPTASAGPSVMPSTLTPTPTPDSSATIPPTPSATSSPTITSPARKVWLPSLILGEPHSPP